MDLIIHTVCRHGTGPASYGLQNLWRSTVTPKTRSKQNKTKWTIDKQQERHMYVPISLGQRRGRKLDCEMLNGISNVSPKKPIW